MDLGREIGGRLRAVRLDRWGEDGAQFLADEVGVPLRTWLNFERGIGMPGVVMARFLASTGVDPRWLLTGEGEMYLGR